MKDINNNKKKAEQFGIYYAQLRLFVTNNSFNLGLQLSSASTEFPAPSQFFHPCFHSLQFKQIVSELLLNTLWSHGACEFKVGLTAGKKQWYGMDSFYQKL